MSWQDIIKEDNISKIKLPFGKGSKESANAKVMSIFQEEIGKATTMADLVKAMEQFANQPSAQDIWAEGGARNPLAGAIKNAKEAESSQQQILEPQSRAQQILLEIRANYHDDDLDGGAKEQALLLEHINSLSRYFSRAFGIRDKFMEIVSSNPKEITTLFDKTVQERKAEMNQSKSTTEQPQMSMGGNTSSGDMSDNTSMGKMQGWQTVLKKKPLVGGQKQLDKDKDGDIDGEDFEIMNKFSLFGKKPEKPSLFGKLNTEEEDDVK